MRCRKITSLGHRVADHEALGDVHERRDVVVVDVLQHVKPLRGGADLARVEVGGPGAAPRGDVEMGGDV
jgi:hypothetical protein